MGIGDLTGLIKLTPNFLHPLKKSGLLPKYVPLTLEISRNNFAIGILEISSYLTSVFHTVIFYFIKLVLTPQTVFWSFEFRQKI